MDDQSSGEKYRLQQKTKTNLYPPADVLYDCYIE